MRNYKHMEDNWYLILKYVDQKTWLTLKNVCQMLLYLTKKKYTCFLFELG